MPSSASRPARRRSIAIGLALVAVLASLVAVLALPSRPAGAASPLSADLTRDLNMASAAGLTLSPTGAATQVVSAVELGATTAPAAVAKRPAAPRRPRATPPRAAARVVEREPEPEPAPIAPEVVEERRPAPSPAMDAPLPRPMPNGQREPRGGWKTPSEVIRNAPFPILP